VHFGTLVVQSTQVLQATTIDAEDSITLGVEPHVPAFLSAVTAIDQDNRVAFYLEGIYRGDRCRFVNTSLGQADLTNPQSVVNAHFVIN
jgi:DNA-binding GntR family transcriptional regulator